MQVIVGVLTNNHKITHQKDMKRNAKMSEYVISQYYISTILSHPTLRKDPLRGELSQRSNIYVLAYVVDELRSLFDVL